MAIEFSLEPNRERFIRVPEAPVTTFHVVAMDLDEEIALERSFQSFDRQTKKNVITDPVAYLQTRCQRVIRGWEKLPGKKGTTIPFSPENMDALCKTTSGAALMSAVLRDAGAADAVEAEAAAKN